MHTYTMKSFKLGAGAFKSTSALDAAARKIAGAEGGNTRFLAFKALRRDAVRAAESDGQSRIREVSGGGEGERGQGKTAKEVVKGIVAVLREEGEKVGAVEEGDESWVEEKDIIRCVVVCVCREAFADPSFVTVSQSRSGTPLSSTGWEGRCRKRSGGRPDSSLSSTNTWHHLHLSPNVASRSHFARPSVIAEIAPRKQAQYHLYD